MAYGKSYKYRWVNNESKHLSKMNRYDRAFLGDSQFGSGIKESIGPIFRSRHSLQRGSGIGGIFRGILKYITPYLIRGGKEIGSELLRGSTEILGGIGKRSFSDMFSEQREKSLANLTEKAINKLKRMNNENMQGGAIKRARLAQLPLIQDLDFTSDTPKRGRKQSSNKKKAKKKAKAKPKKKKTTGKKKTKKKASSDSAFLKEYLK